MAILNLTAIKPVALTNLVVNPSVNGAILRWDASANITDKYEVWYNTSNNVNTATKLATVEANSYAAGGLLDAYRYWYWVRTINTFNVTGPFATSGDYRVGKNFKTLTIKLFENGYATDSINYIQYQVWYTPLGGVATSTGLQYFTTAITQASYSQYPAWTNPDNARVNDSNYAVVSATSGTRSLWLNAADTGIPDTATITGIQFTIRGKTTDFTSAILYLYLDGKNGTGTNYLVNAWTANATDQTLTVGSSASLFNFDVATGVATGSVSTTAISSNSVSISGGSSLGAVGSYDTWFDIAYSTFDIPLTGNTIISAALVASITTSSVSVTAGQTLYIQLGVRLFDNTTGAYVPGSTAYEVVYINTNGAAIGALSALKTINISYKTGINSQLIPGHSYKISISTMKYRETGSPTCILNADIGFVSSLSSASTI